MVSRRKLFDDGGETGPECVGRNSGLGSRFLGDEIEQNGGDFQSVGIDTIHDGIFLTTNSGYARSLGGKQQKSPAKGTIQSPFSAKARAMRRPLAPLDCLLLGRSETLKYWRRGRPVRRKKCRSPPASARSRRSHPERRAWRCRSSTRCA